MDQTTLPFASSREHTHTTIGDNNASVSFPNEVFREWQFNMHVFRNSREDDSRGAQLLRMNVLLNISAQKMRKLIVILGIL